MKLSSVLLLLAYAFGTFGCNDKSVGPQQLDYHNKILFTSRRSGKQQLYMMNPDGSNVVQITSGQYEHEGGRWSPDASKIVCNTSEGWTTAGLPIVVFNVNGTGRKVIAIGRSMAWSPDGRRIAYSYVPYGELGVNASYIYVINVDGTGFAQLTAGDLRDDNPCWSPDGSRLYFVSDRHNPGEATLDTYVMNPDGTDIRRITDTPNGWTAIHDISADGTTMLVVSSLAGVFPYATYAMSVDTLVITLIIQPPPQEVYNYPRYSPDEESIVLWGALIDGSTKTHIYAFTIGGTTVTNLVPQDETVGFPDWSR
jgi:Tol biopolymer transport system component